MESETSGKVATIGSYGAGILSAVGWYLFVGALLENGNSPGQFWAPGILGSIGLVLLNVISWEAVTDDGGLGNESVSMRAKVWVVICFIILFCSLFAAIWIFVSKVNEAEHRTGSVLMLMQAGCIFLSAVIFRVVRRHGDDAI
mmetsp:Transcript_68713/g.114204  ORF Transcript_68713/g.114204 Transcript_68713/m.114204 type:complete len:143 (+) Transcript_68713:34-462(+)